MALESGSRLNFTKWLRIVNYLHTLEFKKCKRIVYDEVKNTLFWFVRLDLIKSRDVFERNIRQQKGEKTFCLLRILSKQNPRGEKVDEQEKKEKAKKLVSESEKADPKNLLDNFLLLDNSQMKNDLQNIEKIIKSVLIPQPYSRPLPRRPSHIQEED